MIKIGMFVRCPIDREHPRNPRQFITGKVATVNEFNETACVKFADLFGHRDYFDFIPYSVEEAPLSALDHCHLSVGAVVKVSGKLATIVEYMEGEDGFFDYYVQDEKSKTYFVVDEEIVEASFLSGSANPARQLAKYEFQNPCWYLGRQIVKKTMNVLDNSIFGFKELAGCKIFLKAFQINTIMRCLQSEKCRYMIADEVGLGKTIEAASVLKVYLSDKTNKRVLVAVPRALVGQWRTELLFKFDLVEGIDENRNEISIVAVEDIMSDCSRQSWDFLVVDEVHNYIGESREYLAIHNLSSCTENVLLLSATPIQQRKHEYLRLLRLIQPDIYDGVSEEAFSVLVEKQNRITRLTHSLLDDIDSFRNELLPEVTEENPYENEDVLDQLEELRDGFDELVSLIGDATLKKLVSHFEDDKEDFGIHDMMIAISYVCDNYQIERSIIRGRRAVLGVFPKEENGEFAERLLIDIEYPINDECNYYENEAYRTLKEWIVSNQKNLDDGKIKNTIQPVLEAFFSSPWAYQKRLKQVFGNANTVPDDVWRSADRWVEDEEEALSKMADVMDNVEEHPSRLFRLLDYVERELYGKKVVVFTDQIETFEAYYKAFVEAFGDEVVGFSANIDRDTAEYNVYKFQSDTNCKIMICDKSGGEGRNLQMADYAIHVDLPWNISTIEQRIGRLDRMGRNVSIPVTSIVIHTVDSYEDQLFRFWNQGLNVFRQSLSGIEIIMNDINKKIIESIRTDFEFGLYRVVPDLIREAEQMREVVQREQIFDTAALRYRPLYNQLERLLTNYQFNENKLFANTMMSWASLAGFGEISQGKEADCVSFDEDNFSIRAAQNSFLIPPNWDRYLNKKQNVIAIKAQQGLAEKKERKVSKNNRKIEGTFSRALAIKNDYLHFYAPGDEIFDCIVKNAMCSYRGMATALAAQSSIDWKGFIYTFSIAPNEKRLLDEGISLYSLGLFRQYLSSSILVIPIPFSNYEETDVRDVLKEHNRIVHKGYFGDPDDIEHLGRRGNSGGFLEIPKSFKCSNIEWFRAQYSADRWGRLVDQSSKIARKKAFEKFKSESNLRGAREMIEQVLSAQEAREEYFGKKDLKSTSDLKRQYEIIYESLSKPVIRMESACYMWLVRKNG